MFGAEVIEHALAGCTLESAQRAEVDSPPCRIDALPFAKFCDQWVAYNKANPLQAKAYRETCKDTYGFVDDREEPPRILLNRDLRDPAILIHEGLHIYSNPELREELGPDVNEGVTEYFTRQITDRERIEHVRLHEKPFQKVKELTTAINDKKIEDALRKAYFFGDVNGLRKMVDGRLGTGSLDRWASSF